MIRSPKVSLVRTVIAALVALSALGGVPARAAPQILCEQYVVPMSDGVRFLTIPRNDPVNAYTMAGIVKNAGLTIEQFKELL